MVKGFLKLALDLLLFSSLFISGCAVLMVYQTVQLLHLENVPDDLYAFVFWATMSSYNFHWYLTPAAYSSTERMGWSARHKRLELSLFLFCSLFAAYYLFFLHAYAGWIGIGVVLTFLYTAPKIPHKPFFYLRRIAVGKTLFLTSVWTYITAALPVVISGDAAPGPAILLILHRFLLIYAICLIFDYRDRDQDRQSGIRSLVVYLDERGNDRLFYGCCAAALLDTVLLLFYRFPVAVVTALAVPVLITLLLYPEGKRSKSDYLFYLVLDGLMAFSAVFTTFL
ncbi:MAG TPA: UbiA family prenyltransferase [Dinghuibacter sp.]|uniref:UbiA family prenyltransferase n=1 Tax=Dinghuibacter sp. TaxID=2024697 RepID=UPI002C89DEF0|nr:UbiA family prenyltransferase [Dinghuibacter sp.]HTJ13673.1 UbiA family prenyltransferase [Dinghuibacter sp.]